MVFNRGKDKKETIFRQDALEQLSSPERLDQLMQVIRSVDWLALAGLGGLVVATLLWSVLGRIPVTVEGRGVFTEPRRVVDFQATSSGQLKSLNIRSGQCIKQDELLATVDPTDLQQQLQSAQGKLTQIQMQARGSSSVSDQKIRQEKSAIAASRLGLQQRLQDTTALTPVLKDRGLVALQQQRYSLEQRLQDAQTLVPVMAGRLAQRHNLEAQGAIPKDSLLEIEQQYTQARQSVSDITSQLKQLDLQSTETERRYLDNLRSITDIQAQLQQLDSKGTQLDQEGLESQNQRNREIQDMNREITRLHQQIALHSRILSPRSGCVLEMTATAGQIVQPGMRLGSMQIDGKDGQMLGLSYFAVKDGKQIQPGMKIFITPDTVQRERFGGVVGEIKAVSALPVTPEGAISTIGNPEVVKTLMASGGAAIEVNAVLKPDANTISGYQWSSSKGPASKITPGTTAITRVTVEERPPITFVLPILREISGLK